VEDLIVCHGVFSRRLATLLESLDDRLAELLSIVPLWRNNIERRRAVLLARKLPPL
jgi:hypothetical protein